VRPRFFSSAPTVRAVAVLLSVAATAGVASAVAGPATASEPTVAGDVVTAAASTVSPDWHRIDIAGPVPGTSTRLASRTIRLTDGALYFTQAEVGSAPRDRTVWQQVLYPTATGFALGNPARIGTSYAPFVPPYASLSADDTSVMWRDPTSSLIVHHWDGGMTGRVDTVANQLGWSVPVAWGSGWFANEAGLTPLREGVSRNDVVPLAGIGQSFDAAYIVGVDMTDNLVAWIDFYGSNGRSDGFRLVAHHIDTQGLVGNPVVLEDNPTAYTGADFYPADVEVSEDYVVWTSNIFNSQPRVQNLRWVAVDGLTETPHEYSTPGHVVAPIAVDGNRVAFTEDLGPSWAETRLVVLNLTTGEVETTIPIYPWVTGLALHDDLVAWLDQDEAMHVQSVSGTTTLSQVPTYTDVARTDPFAGHIDELTGTGVVTGHADGTFRPLAPVTREAMAAFLYRLAGSPHITAPPTSPFSDVTTGHPFYTAICWLAQEGISTGWPNADGTATFRPGEPVSREAMAAFLRRMAGAPTPTTTTPPFTDVAAQHPFADAITWMAQTGISTGWDTGAGAEYRPGAHVERQAMAAFLIRYAHLD